MPVKDLSGKKFGRWTVVSFDKTVNWASWWNCVCECGTERSVRGVTLSHGSSKSCGCKTLDRLKSGVMTRRHGMTNTRTWESWASMKKRVLDPKHKNYQLYKKYRICDRWLQSFNNFLADMGVRPENTTLDRIDNDKGYYKENCRWASNVEQANNKSSNRFLTFNGKSLTISQWSSEIGVRPDTIWRRLEADMPIEKVLYPGNLSEHKKKRRQEVSA